MTGRTIPTTGEVAVIGLAKSGISAATLLRRHGRAVYASDATQSDSLRQQTRAIEELGVDVELGGHDLDRISHAALIVVSPGVPPDVVPLVTARAAGVEIISEVELALRCMPQTPYIAVTGTNGKTTTTTLVGHLLRALGHDAVDAGNIGTPLTEVALREISPDWVALELSSFQLHDTPSVDPAVGVLTNLTPDHLDRYPTVERYYADKALLFQNASATSTWVLNADDPTSDALTRGILGQRNYFTTQPGSSGHPRADASLESDTLVVLGAPLLPRHELPLLGTHNVANALAAALAVMIAAPSHQTADAREIIANALRAIRPLPHRLELVGEWNGVQWINDSKATNVSSAFVAVAGMTRPTVLLLGGRHKGEPYTSLADPIRTHVTHVVAYGEAAGQIEHDLASIIPVHRVDGDFTQVMTTARSLARAGDAVLLSPACSSYDMFKNYEDRGAQFRLLARGDTVR